MNAARKLTLKKDVLAELSTDELSQVAGAGTDQCLTNPVGYCLSIRFCDITNEVRCLVPTLAQSCPC